MRLNRAVLAFLLLSGCGQEVATEEEAAPSPQFDLAVKVDQLEKRIKKLEETPHAIPAATPTTQNVNPLADLLEKQQQDKLKQRVDTLEAEALQREFAN